MNHKKSKVDTSLIVKTRGLVPRDSLVPIPIDLRIDPGPNRCFNCWQYNHEYEDCPRPYTAEICFNCGRRGVNLDSCPRCSESACEEHMKKLASMGKIVKYKGVADAEDVWSEVFESDDEASPSASANSSNEFCRGSNMSKDPVKDICILMKSISHLSIPTQDLVVRQVMLERREWVAMHRMQKPNTIQLRGGGERSDS